MVLGWDPAMFTFLSSCVIFQCFLTFLCTLKDHPAVRGIKQTTAKEKNGHMAHSAGLMTRSLAPCPRTDPSKRGGFTTVNPLFELASPPPAYGCQRWARATLLTFSCWKVHRLRIQTHPLEWIIIFPAVAGSINHLSYCLCWVCYHATYQQKETSHTSCCVYGRKYGCHTFDIDNIMAGCVCDVCLVHVILLHQASSGAELRHLSHFSDVKVEWTVTWVDTLGYSVTARAVRRIQCSMSCNSYRTLRDENIRHVPIELGVISMAVDSVTRPNQSSPSRFSFLFVSVLAK